MIVWKSTLAVSGKSAMASTASATWDTSIIGGGFAARRAGGLGDAAQGRSVSAFADVDLAAGDVEMAGHRARSGA